MNWPLGLGIGYFNLLSGKGQRKHKKEEKPFSSAQELGASKRAAPSEAEKWLRQCLWTQEPLCLVKTLAWPRISCVA